MAGDLNRPERVYSDGSYRKEQQLRGLVFNTNTEMGSMKGELSAPVTLSVVRS